MVSPATTYTTEGLMDRLLSAQGVIDYADHDDDNVADTTVTTDCIDQATEEINFYCREHYTAAQLATSSLIERWATVFACRFLCQRRGNSVPFSLEDEFERITPKLDLVASGIRELPGLQKKDELVPIMSNLTIDRRYLRSTVRVTRANSSKAPSKLSQDTSQDYYGGWT